MVARHNPRPSPKKRPLRKHNQSSIQKQKAKSKTHIFPHSIFRLPLFLLYKIHVKTSPKVRKDIQTSLNNHLFQITTTKHQRHHFLCQRNHNHIFLLYYYHLYVGLPRQYAHRLDKRRSQIR